MTDSLPGEMGAELTSITAQAHRNESVLKLVEFARSLPRDDAELLIRCALEGAQVKDLAPLFGVPPKTVTKRWERLRARLKERSIWSVFLEEGA